jgi:hypothetical protein
MDIDGATASVKYCLKTNTYTDIPTGEPMLIPRLDTQNVHFAPSASIAATR